MAHVLIVEDDPDIASLLRRGLGAAGHQISQADGVEAAETLLAQSPPDAAIVDMMLGEDSGADLVARLRARGFQRPVLMLSALSRIEERASGLEAGAQDYIVKPFQLSEVLARLEVQLHRHAAPSGLVTRAGLTWDPQTRLVTGAGRRVSLTEREGELLACLLAQPGVVLSRGELFDRLWARHGGSTENVVDVYVGYLRRKLANFNDYGLSLRTLRGRGFVLNLDTEAGEEEL